MNPTADLAAHPPRPGTLARKCRLAWLVAASTTVMSVGAAAMLAVALLTLFQARRFYTEVMARSFGRVILWLAGVKVVGHRPEPWPARQVVYVSNHTSTLDLFILIALGLPNARFFLSGFLRKLVPLGVMGYLTGTFWTVPQEMPARRTKIFQRAERVLRRTGESVYLSPEGMRVTTGEIGHFNKGAFHLATNLKAPIVPFCIAIPPDVDPGMGLDAHPGVVHVYFQPAIDTTGWELDDLDDNRKRVRDLFVRLHEELRAH